MKELVMGYGETGSRSFREYLSRFVNRVSESIGKRSLGNSLGLLGTSSLLRQPAGVGVAAQ